MPTVLRQNGFEVRIYTHDHYPPHVHVVKGDGVIVLYLNGEDSDEPEVLWVRESYSLSSREQRQALTLVAENHVYLCYKWEDIHGQD